MGSKKQNKNRKKVLQIITKSNFGGAQKYVYELSKKLRSDGFDVVVAFGGEDLLKEKLQNENIKTIQIKSLQRDINIFSDLKVFIDLIKIIHKEKPDIVHLNSSKIGIIGSIAARFCFTNRIIFTIHGLAFNEDRGAISKNFIKFIYLMAVFFSHKSIAVSESVKKNILKIPLGFIVKNKIEVIKNGIEKVEFYERDVARKFISEKIGQNSQKEQNLDSKKIIGTIAELHHIKGINFLIESAKKILAKEPNAIFVVFGGGDDREKLQNQIIDLGLEKKFYLLGYIDNAPKYLKALDLFVLSSIYEALALVILEAKQAGIKIAASNAGGIPEAISNYEPSVLFEPKNVDDMTEKIYSLLEVEEKYSPEDEKTSKNQNPDDSIDPMYQKTIKVYLEK